MLITLNWLKDYLTTGVDVRDIVSALNSLGLESEIKLDRQNLLKNFVIAKVLKVEKHPTVPSLNICKVDANMERILQIVCKANNVREGLKVVLAPIGSIVPFTGMKIDVRKVGNVISEGMLCSEAELFLAKDSDGIMEIDFNANIGDKLINYYSFGDVIISIDITPNRGDCLGVYGIARELAAKGLGFLKELTLPDLKLQSEVSNNIKCEILNLDLIPYFSLWKIRNVGNFELPRWMKQRLMDVEIKIFNNILDVASFISHATGQPLHIYNASKINSKISVGLALQNQRIPKIIDTISGDQYNLDEGDLVHVMDGEVINLSGIIGNATTSFSKNCQDIILEVASFDKNVIAKTAQRLKINTDAKYKFERHVDPNASAKFALISVDLILKLSKGSRLEEKIEFISKNLEYSNEILFDFNYLKQLIGIELTEDKISSLLKSLKYEIKQTSPQTQHLYKVFVPSWKSGIENEADLCQEIIRLYGYNNIGAQNIAVNLYSKPINYRENIKNKIRSLFAYLGYMEIYSWSLHNKDGVEFKTDSQEVLQIENPVSQEMSYLRNSLLPGLIANAKQNQARSENVISIFEIGTIFNSKDISSSTASSNLHLGLLKTGLAKELSLYDGKRASDFCDVKGVIQQMFDELKIDAEYSRPKVVQSFLHPKKSLNIIFAGKEIGFIAELHPYIQKKYDLQYKAIVACLNLEPMLNCSDECKAENHFYPSIYQKVKRDFAFLVDEEKDIADAISALYGIETNLIKQVILFDLFSSILLPEGKKSFTIQVILQSDYKTLTEQEINDIEQKIINFMSEKLNADLRSLIN